MNIRDLLHSKYSYVQIKLYVICITVFTIMSTSFINYYDSTADCGNFIRRYIRIIIMAMYRSNSSDRVINNIHYTSAISSLGTKN